MYAIEGGLQRINDEVVETFRRDVTDGRTDLVVEAGTNGYKGGCCRDAGGRTYLSLLCVSGDFFFGPIEDESGDVVEITIACCGDDSLSAVIQSLEFSRQALKDQCRGSNAQRDGHTLCAMSPEGYAPLEDVGEVPCVATYTDEDGNQYRDGFSVTVAAKALDRIEVTMPPHQTEYVQGEEYDYDGLVVTAFYNNETQEEATGLCDVTPAAGTLADEPGLVAVTISLTRDGVTKEAGFELSVLVIDHIEVTAAPTKQNYYPGEALDYGGLVVTACYENGKREDVTAECTLSPAEGTVPGSEGSLPVTVTFRRGSVEKEAQFGINVTALESVEITRAPSVMEFTEGEAYRYTGIEVTASFGDGTTKVVTTDCSFNPAAGSAATLGTDAVTVTYATSAGSTASATFAITVKKKQVPTVRAIQLLPTTFEESLASIRSVMSIPNKMLQRINSKRSSVFGGASLNIVLCAGNCNYKGSGSVRFALMDITPWVNTEKYIYQFTDPAPGVSQGVRIPSGTTSYREFYPHQYFWENCSGNNMFYIVAIEGEIREDEALSTPWASDLCIGFGSDVYDYNPFTSSGKQPYQALAANYVITDVPAPNS